MGRIWIILMPTPRAQSTSNLISVNSPTPKPSVLDTKRIWHSNRTKQTGDSKSKQEKLKSKNRHSLLGYGHF